MMRRVGVKTPAVQVLKVTLVIIFGVSLVSTILNSFIFRSRVETKQLVVRPFDDALEKDYRNNFVTLVEDYRAAIQPLQQEIRMRNIFSPPLPVVKEPDPIIIKEIVFEPLYLMYMGHIEKVPGEYVAQINWNKETYFLKEGQTVNAWIVMSINPQEVIVMNEQGEETHLPLQKRIFSRQPYAIVRIVMTKEEKKIELGDTVAEYKVLDITKDSVVLSSDKGTITITK